MHTIRMSQRTAAYVTYENDYTLTAEEMEEFLTLEDADDMEDFLMGIPLNRETETNTIIVHKESLDTSFRKMAQ